MTDAFSYQPETERRFRSFEEFFPHYLREHGRPGTRLLHFAGTGLATLLLGAALTNRRWRPWLLLAVPVAGYGPAWLAHFLVERNRPATFRHPLWSLRGDYRMLQLWLSGRLEEQLRQAGEQGPVWDAPRRMLREKRKLDRNDGLARGPQF